MVDLSWLSVTDMSCGSSGLVVGDRSELWFNWLAWFCVTGLSCGSSGLVFCDRSELRFICLALLCVLIIILRSFL